jgi:hypothetical protein
LSPWSNAHSQRALGVGRGADRAAVRPVNALMAARGVHVGDRDHDVGDAGVGEHAQASSTWSIAAMSAIEQPAARSGRITCWWSAGEDVGDSAMKCTPQNTMYSASGRAGLLGELEAVAGASANWMTSSRW